MMHDIPAPEELRDAVDYDPNTGLFVYRPQPLEVFKDERAWKIWTTKNCGREAFATKTTLGYLTGHVRNRRILAHRAAWIYLHGEIPDGHEIDHINGKMDDNRAENLRCVPIGENQRNRALSSRNTSGFHGVSWFAREKRWVARIKRNGRYHSLGYFKHFDDAVKARKDAEVAFGFHPNHGRARRYDA